MVASKSSCPSKFVVCNSKRWCLLLFVALFVWMGESKNQVSKQLAGPIQAFLLLLRLLRSAPERLRSACTITHFRFASHRNWRVDHSRVPIGSPSSAPFSLSSFAKRQHTRYYLPTYLHTYLQVGNNEKGPKLKIQKVVHYNT